VLKKLRGMPLFVLSVFDCQYVVECKCVMSLGAMTYIKYRAALQDTVKRANDRKWVPGKKDLTATTVHDVLHYKFTTATAFCCDVRSY
jgi:hypothetical protein